MGNVKIQPKRAFLMMRFELFFILKSQSSAFFQGLILMRSKKGEKFPTTNCISLNQRISSALLHSVALPTIFCTNNLESFIMNIFL